MAMQAEGIWGERVAHALMKVLKYKHFQSDLITQGITLPGNRKIEDWILLEVKFQEYFQRGNNCAFDGHGLPPYQVQTRLKFSSDMNIDIYLLIFEKNEIKMGDYIWIQSLRELNSKEYYDTEGEKKRRIYPLRNFLFYKKGWRYLQEIVGHEDVPDPVVLR